MRLTTDKLRTHCAALIGACFALTSGSARAGASLLVDDATVTPAGHCQVETWARAYSHDQELAAVPACNYAGTEFSIGANELFSPRNGPYLTLGAKHLWKDFDQAPFGIGTSVGATWNTANGRLEVLSVNIPASVALDAQRTLVLHANFGWLDTRGLSHGLAGGAGIERVIVEKTVLLAEFYAQHDHVRIIELGVRHVVNEYASVDVLLGHQDQLASGSTFLTLGFNLQLH